MGLKFSIVIPCYNAEKHVAHAIEYIKLQSYNNWEVIIVDDGSNDDTIKVANRKAESCDNIKVLKHSENKGAAAARNTGLQEASGDYILFWDVDDIYDVKLLETVYNEIEKNDPDVVVYSLVEEYTKGDRVSYSKKHTNPDGFYFTDRLIHRTVARLERETMLGYPWNKAYRLSLLKDNKIQFPDIEHVEDILFNIEVMDYVKKLSVLSEAMYHYRNGGIAGSSGRKFPNYFELQKTRVNAFLDQQDRWKNCDDYVLETAAATYFRSFVSFIEREIEAGALYSEIIEKTRDEMNTDLFLRLKDHVSGGRIARMLYQPLADGDIYGTVKKVMHIKTVKNLMPGVYNRLKQIR